MSGNGPTSQPTRERPVGVLDSIESREFFAEGSLVNLLIPALARSEQG